MDITRISVARPADQTFSRRVPEAATPEPQDRVEESHWRSQRHIRSKFADPIRTERVDSADPKYREVINPKCAPWAHRALYVNFEPLAPWRDLPAWDGVAVRARPVADHLGGEQVWTLYDRGGLLSVERSLKADDGGPDWTVCYEGVNLFRERIEKDPQGGPDWLVSDYGWGDSTKERIIPAEDGGPEWTEVETASGRRRSRAVEASDGGPPWRETETDGSVSRFRRLPDSDGLGDWSERWDSHSGFISQRNYSQGGQQWTEFKQKNNRFRVRGNAQDLKAEAEAKGTHQFVVPGADGPLQVQISGALTPAHLEAFQRALLACPPQARQYGQKIYVAKGLGDALNDQGQLSGWVQGLGGSGDVILDERVLSNRDLRQVLYHEMGHNADFSRGWLSRDESLWSGPSVTRYGETNAKEDFAEVHAAVLESWPRLTDYTRRDWSEEPLSAKKQAIFEMYGGHVAPEKEPWSLCRWLASTIGRWTARASS